MNTSTWTRKNARKRYDKERAKAKEQLINNIDNKDQLKIIKQSISDYFKENNQ